MPTRVRARVGLAVLGFVMALGADMLPTAGLAAGGHPRIRAGYRDAEVAFGPAAPEVGRLPLTAGRWWIIVKAVLESPDPAVSSCQLVTSSGVQRPVSEYATTSVNQRRTVVATALVDLEYDGYAMLYCGDAYDAGAKISWLKMAAVRLGRFRHRALPGGSITTAGLGGTRVEMGSRFGPKTVTSDWLTLGRLPLAAGRWWVLGKLGVARDDAGAGVARVECRLLLGASGPLARERLYGTVGSSVALQQAARLGGSSSARLRCRSQAHDMRVRHLDIAALRLGRLVSGRLGGPYAGSGSGAPEVRTGSREGPVGIPDSGLYTKLGSLPLPAGRWLVVATASLDLAAGSGSGALLYCRLDAEGDFDRAFDVGLSKAATPPARMAPLALMVVHDFDAPGKARLECLAVGTDAEATSVRIMALRAGQLSNVDITPP